jgi:hypothetical protein
VNEPESPASSDLALIHKSENEPEKPIGKAEFFWKLNSAKALGEPSLQTGDEWLLLLVA